MNIPQIPGIRDLICLQRHYGMHSAAVTGVSALGWRLSDRTHLQRDAWAELNWGGHFNPHLRSTNIRQTMRHHKHTHTHTLQPKNTFAVKYEIKTFRYKFQHSFKPPDLSWYTKSLSHCKNNIHQYSSQKYYKNTAHHICITLYECADHHRININTQKQVKLWSQRWSEGKCSEYKHGVKYLEQS